jgi:hypothetical protein
MKPGGLSSRRGIGCSRPSDLISTNENKFAGGCAGASARALIDGPGRSVAQGEGGANRSDPVAGARIRWKSRRSGLDPVYLKQGCPIQDRRLRSDA